MSESHPPNTTLHPFSEIDRLIHSPARLMVLTYLYVVDRADYLFLINMTGLSWGNLSSHLAKLEQAGYVAITKSFIAKKSHTTVELTEKGRAAFRSYKQQILAVLSELPD
ncbi:MAG: transcriptional regulator [Anaerolineae bacterium]|nr:MAG: transcriptional regulator [Anaerolineae bacterium]